MQTNSLALRDAVFSNRKSVKGSLVALMSLYSILIAAYSLIIGTRFAPQSSRSDVEGAALDVARALASVSVPSRRFGPVRLCDTVSDTGMNTPGLNTLAATVRLDGLIAKRLQLKHITALVDKDAEELEHLNKELAHSLYRVIQPNYYMESAGERVSIYERAYKAVNRGAQGRTLVGLKLSLGKLQSFALNSMTPSTRVSGMESLKYDDGKYYVCHLPVPVSDDSCVSFYELAPEPTLVDHSQFAEGAPSETSSVVLLEATFESFDNSGFKKIITRESSCAVVGGSPIKPVDGALVLSFPSGGLDKFSSLKDFANCNDWRRSGEWQQAVDGAVPGDGHLAPPLGIEAANAPPGEAIALCIYHWLISMGPSLNIDLVEKMFSAPFSFSAAGPQPKTQTYYSNSAIVRNTGAARFALLSQTKPQGLGQQILSTAFSRPISYPASALPMAVDHDGNCRIPGRNDCDAKLICDFLEHLHKTNVAAIETKAVSEIVIKRVENARQECYAKISALGEEKRSLSGVSPAVLAQLEERIATEEARGAKYSRVANLAVRASVNAKRTVDATYEMASELGRYASLGLDRVTGDTSCGYILSRSLVFVPHVKPMSETDLYEVAEAKPGKAVVACDWLKDSFEVAETPDESMRVSGTPIVQFWQEAPNALNNIPGFVVLSSGELRGKGKGRPCVLNFSPFTAGGVGRSQLLYYAPEAVSSGGAPEVRWSLLIRDLVAFQDTDSGHPPPAESPSWWADSHMNGEVPVLCGEIQIRTPVPNILNIPSGSSVQNPNLRESIPLVPPMPAELL